VAALVWPLIVTETVELFLETDSIKHYLNAG
jgi:hypothetical protein